MTYTKDNDPSTVSRAIDIVLKFIELNNRIIINPRYYSANVVAVKEKLAELEENLEALQEVVVLDIK